MERKEFASFHYLLLLWKGQRAPWLWTVFENSLWVWLEVGSSIRALGWRIKRGAPTRVIISNPLGDFYFKYGFLCPCGIWTSWGLAGSQIANCHSDFRVQKVQTRYSLVPWPFLIRKMLKLREGMLWEKNVSSLPQPLLSLHGYMDARHATRK